MLAAGGLERYPMPDKAFERGYAKKGEWYRPDSGVLLFASEYNSLPWIISRLSSLNSKPRAAI
jgi:hypothetical protein